MDKHSRMRISKGTVVFVLVSLAVLGLVVVLGIMPAMSEKTELEAEAVRLESRIEEQKILYPLYASITSKLSRKVDLEIIIEEMDRGEETLYIDNAAALLLSMADSAGLTEARFTPVPESVTKDSTQLQVEGSLKGEYRDFRRFLLELSSSGNFRQLELFEVQSREEGMEYKIRVWMSIG
jgi:Tfp pilus assembly protein PilO